MADPLRLDPNKTAVVIMDFQNDIVKIAPDPRSVLRAASQVLQGARRAGVPVVYIQHRGGAFAQQSPGVEIHLEVAPAAGEAVLVKTKAGSFSTTGLDALLREKGIDTLVLMGVATSGCVLSTVRWAADISYKIVVVSDGCADRDAEVHRVLTEKLFPRQGTVVTAQGLLQALQ